MVEIFISYSHADEGLRNELGKHLMALKRQNLISIWHDRCIIEGQALADEIDAHIESADIILLLISADFIASEYCYKIELNRAMQRHNGKDAVVLPVIIRPCSWQDLPFGKLLATPIDGKPIMSFTSLDEGFLEVVEAIKRIINRISPAKPEAVGFPNMDSGSIVRNTISRSGNLHIKKEFSDEEKDTFELEAFEYIFSYFENSLKELAGRNSFITYRCRRIDANSFESIIYNNGAEVTSCLISNRKDNMFSQEISFSYNRTPNSSNEILSIDNDGYTQYLKSTMGFGYGTSGNENLTMEGAAEHFWQMLIKNLQ